MSLSIPSLVNQFGRRPRPATSTVYTDVLLGPAGAWSVAVAGRPQVTDASTASTLGVIYAVVTEAARFEAMPPAIVEGLLDGTDNHGLLGLFDLLIQEGRGTSGYSHDVIVDVRDRIADTAA